MFCKVFLSVLIVGEHTVTVKQRLISASDMVLLGNPHRLENNQASTDPEPGGLCPAGKAKQRRGV